MSIKVISVGFDRMVFEEGSEARERLLGQAARFEAMHVIVFSRRNHDLKAAHLAPNLWLYPTNSLSRWLYIRDAIRIGTKIIENWKLKIGNSGNDVVMTCQDPFETGLAARKISKRFGIPLHVQIHTDFLDPEFSRASWLNRLRILIAKSILPHAAGIRVVSKRILLSIENAGFKLQAIPVVLPVFIDVSRFKRERSDVLQKKYPQFKTIVLLASRLSPEKDVLTAIHAFGSIRKDNPSAGLIIVGDGREKKRLEKCIRNRNLGEAVILEGNVPFVMLSEYYRSADIFLQTSLFEGFGRTLIESALSGTPIVSTDVGIAPELLGKDAVCPVKDEACIGEKLRKLAADPEERRREAERVGKNLQQFTLLDGAAYAAEYESLLTSL